MSFLSRCPYFRESAFQDSTVKVACLTSTASTYFIFFMCSAEESTASTLRCTYDLASVSTTHTSKSVTTLGCQQPRTPRHRRKVCNLCPRSAMRAGTLFLSSASLATGSRMTSLYAIEARSPKASRISLCR